MHRPRGHVLCARLWGGLSVALHCRHYTFYLWKDFLAVHPGAKFTLLPMYLYSAWSVWHSLEQGPLPVLGILGLALACCLALIPAWLLDFR